LPALSHCQKSTSARATGWQLVLKTAPDSTNFVPAMPLSISEARSGEFGVK
jgi:hypothetical protein